MGQKSKNLNESIPRNIIELHDKWALFALSELCCFENEGQNLISCIPKSLVFFLKKPIHSWLVRRNVEKFCVILWWLRSNAGQFLE